MFGNENAFKIAIIVVPALAYLLYRVFMILRNINKFLDKETRKKLLYEVSYPLAAIKYISLVVAFLFLIMALARPLGDPVRTEQVYSGIDIMITVDASSSMGAMDIRPDRMETVKRGLKSFVGALAGDRAGLIAFAGVDFVQCPLTVDYEALELIIDNLYPGMLFKDGTALGNAIRSAVDRLDMKAEKSRAMILITDGENTTGVDPMEAARLALQKNIRIYAIGVGTKKGGRVPASRDRWGRVRFKTHKGRVVISKLEDAGLKEISKITGGKYYRLANKNAFKGILQDIQKMEANKAKVKKQVKYKEKYQNWLFLGLVFLVLSVVIPVRRIELNFRK